MIGRASCPPAIYWRSGGRSSSAPSGGPSGLPAGGRCITITILAPDPTPENIRELSTTARRWKAQGIRLTGKGENTGGYRAVFAGDVAFAAADGLRAHACCVLAAQDQLDLVRGLILFFLHSDGSKWEIPFATVDPDNQGGSLNRDPYRGIGTELLGAAVADMSTTACTRLELETLDGAAEEFWRRRGFHNTTEPLHMTCPEMRALAARLAHTETDDPLAGDVLLADAKASRRAFSLRV